MNSTTSRAAILLILASVCAPPSGANDAGQARGRTAAFRRTLEKDGFIVGEGATRLVDALSLVDRRVLDSSAGNNAGQYYKRFYVPSHPSGEDRAGISVDAGEFHLKTDEAVVYVGPTPPPCDYFSFCPFLFVRHYDDVPGKGTWLFASVGDPLNIERLKTEAPGSPFRSETMVIFAADRGIYTRVKNAARNAGYPESMINCYVFPSSVLRLGTELMSDTLLIILRTANIKSKSQERSYLNNDDYGTVYRVTPATAPDHLRPFDYPPARNREFRPEGGTMNARLRDGLERLKAAILAKTPRVSHRAFESIRWFYDSRDVLKENPASPAYRQFVAGESSDTPYLRSSENGIDPANFTLGKNDMVVVYGVNHTATGLATYSNFGVYGEWRTNHNDIPFHLFGINDFIWNGVAGENSHHFAGSAEYYIPGDPMAPYLYAVRVVRGAIPKGDRHCVVLPEPTIPWWVEPSVPGTADGIGLDQPAMIGYRAYLNPQTKVGPSYNDIIPDRAIWFNLH